MKSSSSLSRALFWTAAVSQQSGVFFAARAQELTFDFAGGNLMSASLDGQSLRDLQTASNPCYLEGAYLVCNYGYEMQGQTYDKESDTTFPTTTSVAFQAKCVADANIGFDYRRSTSCACQATVTKTESDTKTVYSQQNCPCQVCAAELGDSPIHINCTEAQDVAIESTEQTIGAAFGSATSTTTSTSFIVQNCTSVDCFGYCNSTCSLNCDNSTGIPPCDFCTATDTKGEIETGGDGEGKKDIGAFGEETSRAGARTTTRSMLLLAMAAATATTTTLLALVL